MAKATKKTNNQTAKRSSKTNKKVSKKELIVPEEIKVNNSEPEYFRSSEPTQSTAFNSAKPNQLQYKTLFLTGLTAVVTAILVYVFTNHGMPMVAMVNGQPIFRWDLNSTLSQRYGQQTLDGMITEKLISSEMSKEHIEINQEDIDARAKEILSSFGSSLSVDEFLKLQGISRDEFNKQLRLQLAVQKILTKDLKINDSDIANYIASNSAVMTATDPAKLKDEVRSAIIDEHVSKTFNSWLEGLKTKASIQQFL